MLSGLFNATALPLELCALFAVWNWSRRERSAFWMIGGGVLLTCTATLAILVNRPFPAHVHLGFAGMYIFSGLAWAWVVDGLAPQDWKMGEAMMAFIATGMFALANSGW